MTTANKSAALGEYGNRKTLLKKKKSISDEWPWCTEDITYSDIYIYIYIYI